MSDVDVHAWADQLRQYATHFVEGDWEYTRSTKIRHIRFEGDWSGYDNVWHRLARTVRHFLWTDRIERDVFGHRLPMAWRHPIVTIRVGLRTAAHQPDGVLNGGNIITNWEEHGEYLQYVQPCIGALLADLMDAHPDLPEVEALAVEMKRINDDYGRRVADEDTP